MRYAAFAAATAVLAMGAHRLTAAELAPELNPSEAVLPEPSSLSAIQVRKYQLDHEFLFAGGVLPVDPFYKSVIGTVGYTLHFTDNLAWEVVQFSYAYNVETSLTRKVRRTAEADGVDAPKIPALQWMVATHLVLKPLYGKEAFFNTRVVHLEAFLLAGPAVLSMTEGSKLDPGFDFGGGLRLWLSRTWSTRIDLGEVVYFHQKDNTRKAAKMRVRQSLELRLGFAATLGGDE
jgi:outer membrane beta-barrel protein